MNKKSQLKLAMYESVIATLRGKQSLLDNSPALQNAVNKLDSEISVFKAQLYHHSGDITWITAKKNQLCDSMCTKAFAINKILVAFACVNGYPEIVNRFHIQSTEYMKGGIQGKLARVKNLIDVLPSYLGDLLIYNVSQSDFNELVDLYSELEMQTNAPRMAIAHKSVITKSLEESIKRIDHIIKFELDAIMLQIQSLDPETYQQYIAVRKLVKYQSKHRNPESGSSDQDDGSDG